MQLVDAEWACWRLQGLLPMLENPCKSVRADARTRTGDPFITSEVLYQLSYVGVCRDFLDFGLPLPRLVLQRCCKISVGLCYAQA